MLTMTPFKDLPKLGTYIVETQGTTFEVNVVGSAYDPLVSRHVDSLKDTKVVGVDVKPFTDGCDYRGDVLVLCSGSRCLLIYLLSSSNVVARTTPNALAKFVENSRIRFVKAMGHGIFSVPGLCSRSGETVGELAAKVMVNPSLESSSLADIAREVGVPDSSFVVENEGLLLTQEDKVKLATGSAITAYEIAHKLCGMETGTGKRASKDNSRKGKKRVRQTKD